MIGLHVFIRENQKEVPVVVGHCCPGFRVGPAGPGRSFTRPEPPCQPQAELPCSLSASGFGTRDPPSDLRVITVTASAARPATEHLSS
jgi:hypothetical protein